MTDNARLIAVADLLVDEERLIDLDAIANAAAAQAARLTRAGHARVSLVGPSGAVVTEYPANPDRGWAPALLEASVSAGETTGIVSLADPVDGGFTDLDAWLLDIVARRIESQVGGLDLRQSEKHTTQLMRDAEVAGELQRALVTADRRETVTATAAGDLRPACQVGGDLFDLLEVDGDLVAVIADVSGKGAPAALLTAALLSTVQAQVTVIGARPAALLAAVSSAMEGMLHRTGRIVTLAIAAVDSRAGVVRIASAGHHPVFLASGGSVTVVRPTCPPLGVVPPSADEHVLDFPSGATVLLASDGLVDQCDPWGIPFGMRQLADSFAIAVGDAPSAIVAQLLKAIRTHAGVAPQDDDRAAVVFVSRSQS